MLYPAADINLEFAATILGEGDIIIYPTDTLYGFGVDATNARAVERLDALKQRARPLSIVLSAVGEIDKYAEIPPEHKTLLKKLLPGPYTVLLPKKDSAVVSAVTRESPLIGIRIPAHPFPTSLVAMFGRPITTTSINRHGENPSLTLEEIITAYPQILTFKDGEAIAQKGSTIVDLSGEIPLLIRRGAGAFPL
ncbi:MAG: threonylcarbamoyl-AMP synthase [FCB group bacterium]|nr:threonylcarbamoyl-AMP synthase [FCB group bacterium]